MTHDLTRQASDALACNRPRRRTRARYGAGEGPRRTDFTEETFLAQVHSTAQSLGSLQPRALYDWHRAQRDSVGYDNMHTRVVESGLHLLRRWREVIASIEGECDRPEFVDYLAHYVWANRAAPVPDSPAFAEIRRFLPKPSGRLRIRPFDPSWRSADQELPSNKAHSA